MGRHGSVRVGPEQGHKNDLRGMEHLFSEERLRDLRLFRISRIGSEKAF